MNQHILIAMDWENRSRKELKENFRAAANLYYAAFDAARADYGRIHAANAEQWINKYFEVTGENREEYEKALEEMKK